MYTSYFGLKESPFNLTPDPRFLFLSHRHREALAHLLFGMGDKGGFVLLTGEVGTGKTTLCRSLLEQVPDDVEIALILNPKQTALELVASICDELKVSHPAATESLKVLIDHLNRHLLETHTADRRTVVIIDEAQNLTIDVLEQVRLLTNLETTTQKLLQILLIGQPELQGIMARPELRQLAQRIIGRYHLAPLQPDETAAYIEHRLEVAGARRPLFKRPILRLIHSLSGGVPRLINTICDRALLGAYAKKRTRVSRRLAKAAAGEVMGKKGIIYRSRRPWAAALVVLFLVGTGWFFFQDEIFLDPIKTWWTQESAPGTKSPPMSRKPPPITSTLLKKGDSGPDVRWLKHQLNFIEGLPKEDPQPENPVFDDLLEQRVIRFQRSRGVNADGIVGEQTLVQLTAAKPYATGPRTETPPR